MPTRPTYAEYIEMPTASEERELARHIVAGDANALKRFLRRHWEDVVRYTLHVIGSQDQADDIAQEAFIRLWMHRNRWRGRATLRPVLFRIARNLALNELRRGSAFRRLANRVRVNASAADASPSAFQNLVSADLDRVMRQAVDALPERRREVFVLVRFHGMSHPEASEVLGITTQAVANHVSRALADLHIALAPHLDGDSSQPIDFPLSRSAAVGRGT